MVFDPVRNRHFRLQKGQRLGASVGDSTSTVAIATGVHAAATPGSHQQLQVRETTADDVILVRKQIARQWRGCGSMLSGVRFAINRPKTFSGVLAAHRWSRPVQNSANRYEGVTAVAGSDSMMRLLALNGSNETEMVHFTGPGLSTITCMAFSPAGGHMAISYLGDGASPGHVQVVAARRPDVTPEIDMSWSPWHSTATFCLQRGSIWSCCWMSNDALVVGSSPEAPSCLLRLPGAGSSSPGLERVSRCFGPSDVFAVCPFDAGDLGSQNGDGEDGEDRHCVIMGRRNGDVAVWDCRGKNADRVIKLSTSVASIHRMPASGLVLLADAGTQLQLRDPRLWDRPMGPPAQGYVNSHNRLGVAVDAATSTVAACCSDGAVRCWDDRLRLLAEHRPPPWTDHIGDPEGSPVPAPVPQHIASLPAARRGCPGSFIISCGSGMWSFPAAAGAS